MMTTTYIRLRAFHLQHLLNAKQHLQVHAKAHGIALGHMIPLPTKRKRFTLLRSPHVNKRSQEHFETRTYSRLIQVHLTERSNLGTFRQDLLRICPSGVTFTFKTEVT